MKVLGMLLIITAGTALGNSAGNDLRKRYRSLMELNLLMGFLKGELCYGADPLEKVFERLSQRSESCLGVFFRRVSENMKRQENISLKEILQEEQEWCLRGSGLTEREQEQLVKICCILGQADRTTQNVTLEEYQYELHQEGNDAGEQMKQKEHMYRCLGFMGGLFFAVLLY